ncbi:metal-dependent hydrolase [Methanohalophilus portucalensis]|uniref:Metal-dependent hydrolase n=2 Tax=Methanohalophilus portucalensis TaxID=39664 RepID=A0A2D3C5T0_9EURY|nr:metal-dependent hydrolase [Methanohalophilus portucalensis]ATU08083.1 hypothetical protein BKM01_04400 [Methanohalophilus portucalensis]RNI10060.1 metal-dependent hydrolase [Methanohalophilus portucalensis FDF-1]SMH44455.1 LexA-binding, inner membrane-associated putative hydrolase [Methanohalophilus portucalensis FDF-1]
MFVFGHVGLTILAFYLAEQWLPRLQGKINYGFVAIGALLPDLIDKPLGRFLLADSLASGRIFAHTLIFWILVGLIIVLIWQKWRADFLLILPGAAVLHLLEDSMWQTPEVLFWPFMGWGFRADEIGGGFMDYLLHVFSNCYDPAMSMVFVSEVFGIMICMVGAVRWYRRNRNWQ